MSGLIFMVKTVQLKAVQILLIIVTFEAFNHITYLPVLFIIWSSRNIGDR